MNPKQSSRVIPLDKCEVVDKMTQNGEEVVVLNTIEKGTDLNTMIPKRLVDLGCQISFN